jgi:hypothetical protein
MTEDGNEKGNVFSENLGALTRRATVLIPDNGTNGKETDDNASTYWISSATNTFIGNVAAGSESNGYWLELRDSVRGPNPEEFAVVQPKRGPLTLFSNNVAHSNQDVSYLDCIKLFCRLSWTNIPPYANVSCFAEGPSNLPEWFHP